MIYSRDEVNSWPEGHKRCFGCEIIKPLADFHKMKQGLYGVNTYCKSCRVPISREQRSKVSFERGMYNTAKSRATLKGRNFSISIDDISIPDVCPILGVPIVMEKGHQYAPSIDRIDSNLGYIPGNVQVVSRRANTLKNNMTAEEAMLINLYFNA